MSTLNPSIRANVCATDRRLSLPPSQHSNESQYFAKYIVPAITKYWNAIRQETWGPPIENQKKETQEAEILFKNAVNTVLPFIILGDGTIREDLPLLNNLGILSVRPEPAVAEHMIPQRTALQIGDLKNQDIAQDPFFTRGSVLVDSDWSILRNDTAMMGSILSHREFHLATPEGNQPKVDILWDATARRVRVLGRELAMLYLANYHLYELPKQGIILIPSKHSRLRSLEENRQFIASIRSVEEVFAMMTQMRRPIHEFFTPPDRQMGK